MGQVGNGAAIRAKAGDSEGLRGDLLPRLEEAQREAGAAFAGLSLPDWAALLAIIYTTALLIQMGVRFTRWCWLKWHERRKP